VKVPKVGSLTLEQWLTEYERLKKANEGDASGGAWDRESAKRRFVPWSPLLSRDVGDSFLFVVEIDVQDDLFFHEQRKPITQCKVVNARSQT
jgi:hypothetical protein